MPAAWRRPETKDIQRMVVTSDAMQCVRVSVNELRMTKTQQTRSRQRSRPVELCPDVHNCTKDCTFVHPRDEATYKSWTFRQVHANLQVVAADDENVRYPRCAAPGSVTTLCPNTKAVVEQEVPIGHLLQTLATKCVTDGQRVVLCPHFYFEQACNMGARCHFAHVLTVKPKLTVTPHRLQWAPKKIVESTQRPSSGKTSSEPEPTPELPRRVNPASVLPPSGRAVPPPGDFAVVARSVAPLGLMPLQLSVSCMSDSGSAHSSTPPSTPATVYRFDPYGCGEAVRKVRLL